MRVRSCRGDARGGAQAEAVRVPLADGTLVKAPVGEDSVLLPSLLTLSDVFLTGHHAAVKAHVDPPTTGPWTSAARSRSSYSPEPLYVKDGPGYCRDSAMRISLSVSVMSSPLTSTVTLCRVPVNRNGDL